MKKKRNSICSTDHARNHESRSGSLKKSYLPTSLLIALLIAITFPQSPTYGQLKELWDIGRDIYEMRQKSRREREEQLRRNLPRTNIATIRWVFHWNTFIILGPNPEGEWAAKGYKWMPLVILFESDCRDTVYLDSQLFRLEEHNGPKAGRVYSPTTRGMQYQKDRLKNGWIRPGEEREGYLTFQVPDLLYNSEYQGYRNLAYSLHYPKKLSGCDVLIRYQ